MNDELNNIFKKATQTINSLIIRARIEAKIEENRQYQQIVQTTRLLGDGTVTLETFETVFQDRIKQLKEK